MQSSEMRDNFPRVQECIDNAAELCRISSRVPDDLRECLSELDRESDHARRVLQRDGDETHVFQCIDRLEKLGDRAMQACDQAGNSVDREVRAAVRQAHDAIATLKHRLH